MEEGEDKDLDSNEEENLELELGGSSSTKSVRWYFSPDLGRILINYCTRNPLSTSESKPESLMPRVRASPVALRIPAEGTLSSLY